MGLCSSLGWHRTGPAVGGRTGWARQCHWPPASLRGANTTPQYWSLGLHQSDSGLSLGLTWAKDSRHHTLIYAKFLKQLSLAWSFGDYPLQIPVEGNLHTSPGQLPVLQHHWTAWISGDYNHNICSPYKTSLPLIASLYLCYHRV